MEFSLKEYGKDLEILYQLALGKGNLTAAIKIKELQVKVYQNERVELEKFDLKNLDDDKLNFLIDLLERKIKHLPY